MTSGQTARRIAVDMMDDFCSITAVKYFLNEEFRFCSSMLEDIDPEDYDEYDQQLQYRLDKCIEGLHKINNINYYSCK